jgi:site-specific DNA-adenine methylase
MNYGLPYQGSKNRIAKRLVDALPSAPVLYDVFCGGCAVTHAAMLSGKYQRFVINDRRGWLPAAFQKAIHGDYAHEDRWISREDFERLKSTDAYAAMCFSFGNDCRSYMYAQGLEPYKRALHYAIFWRDFAPWAALCPETADALASGLAPIEDRKQRRVQAGHFIVESLKAQLAAGTLTPDILDKPIYRQIRRVRATSNSLQSLERLQSLESLERLERLQSLESLESLQSLQSLESLECLQSLESLERLQSLQSLESLERLPGALTVYSMDYREMRFDEPGIIYCDPPYKDTADKSKDYADTSFDAEVFYSWCEAQKLPVYISEYQMPEERFVCIAEWNKVTTMAAKTTSHVTERLWRPRTQL